jgi:hypothetical protein
MGVSDKSSSLYLTELNTRLVEIFWPLGVVNLASSNTPLRRTCTSFLLLSWLSELLCSSPTFLGCKKPFLETTVMVYLTVLQPKRLPDAHSSRGAYLYPDDIRYRLVDVSRSTNFKDVCFDCLLFTGSTKRGSISSGNTPKSSSPSLHGNTECLRAGTLLLPTVLLNYA